MHAVVAREVDALDGDARDPPGRLLADRGQHGAVVVGVHVLVEQVLTCGRREGVEHGRVPALADVHHALEHPSPPIAPTRRPLHPTGTLVPVNLGAPELIIILLIVLLIFGGTKLPQLARSLGKAQSEFKKGSEEDDAATADRGDTTPPPV